jgi:hypothetical protein
VEADLNWVDVAVAEEENGTKDWLGKEVEDTVEDGFRVWRNDIAALAEAPSDRVDEPEEDGPETAGEIGCVDCSANMSSICGMQG